jgi:hypothetical protein
MTHDQLLAKINKLPETIGLAEFKVRHDAILAVVKLHKPYGIDQYPGLQSYCVHCEHLQSQIWPCPTIEAIEKELA